MLILDLELRNGRHRCAKRQMELSLMKTNPLKEGALTENGAGIGTLVPPRQGDFLSRERGY
jgi:hypothetical protein